MTNLCKVMARAMENSVIVNNEQKLCIILSLYLGGVSIEMNNSYIGVPNIHIILNFSLENYHLFRSFYPFIIFSVTGLNFCNPMVAPACVCMRVLCCSFTYYDLARRIASQEI